MFEIKNRWQALANKQKWAARGASIMAKAKATKLVWFPPKPDQSAKDAVSTGQQATSNIVTGQ
jgi:hypothetical protein